MIKDEKLIKDLEKNPKNVRFETLKKLLENAGYVATNNGSSHWQFRKPGRDLITIPRQRPMKVIYVIEALKALKKEKK